MTKLAKVAKQIKKFYADEKVDAKIRKCRVHLTCIATGVVIAVGTTFISSALVIHFGVVIATAPSIVQEIIDRMFSW